MYRFGESNKADKVCMFQASNQACLPAITNTNVIAGQGAVGACLIVSFVGQVFLFQDPQVVLGLFNYGMCFPYFVENHLSTNASFRFDSESSLQGNTI